MSSGTFIISDVQSIFQTITNSGLIPGGQNLSKRQTVFLTSVDPMDKTNKDPVAIDLNEPRHAQNMHKAWKKHHNTVYWVDINLVLEKQLKFFQTRSNAINLYNTLPACCVPKTIMMEAGEIIYENFCVTSTSSEDFLQRQLDERIGFRSCWR